MTRLRAVKKKPTSVKTPRNKRGGAPRRLLVPVDFSDSSLRALRYAAELAADSGGSLTIVHVVAADYGWLDLGREEYRDLDKSLQKQAAVSLGELADQNVPKGVPTNLEVRIGRPADEIVAAASEAKADLIVLSTHGRTGLNRFLIGSVAERVAARAPCPVYLMPRGERTAVRPKPGSAVLRLKHER